MEKSVGNERGLSPVIASVLMILLVLTLAVLIFSWSQGFISEQIEKFGQPVEELCSSVDFKVEKIENVLGIVNIGNVDIRHFDIKLFKDGGSEINRFDFQVDAGKSVKEFFTFSIDDPDKIIIYPALIGNVKGKSSNKIFTCLDAGVTL